MSSIVRKIHSLKELGDWAKELAPGFSSRQIVALIGPMGAGKTEIVRAFIKALGGRGVSSPTFALHQRYPLVNGFADHIDLYRLQKSDELESMGFWDLFRAESGLIFIEWADRLESNAWPRNWSRIEIKIEALANGTRRMEMVNEG